MEATTTTERPWNDLTQKLLPKYGAWADYEAWTRWMNANVDYEHDEPITDTLSGVQSAHLYAAMCDLVERRQPGQGATAHE